MSQSKKSGFKFKYDIQNMLKGYGINEGIDNGIVYQSALDYCISCVNPNNKDNEPLDNFKNVILAYWLVMKKEFCNSTFNSLVGEIDKIAVDNKMHVALFSRKKDILANLFENQLDKTPAISEHISYITNKVLEIAEKNLYPKTIEAVELYVYSHAKVSQMHDGKPSNTTTNHLSYRREQKKTSAEGGKTQAALLKLKGLLNKEGISENSIKKIVAVLKKYSKDNCNEIVKKHPNQSGQRL